MSLFSQYEKNLAKGKEFCTVIEQLTHSREGRNMNVVLNQIKGLFEVTLRFVGGYWSSQYLFWGK